MRTTGGGRPCEIHERKQYGKGLSNMMIRAATAADADALLELNSLFGNETTLQLLKQSILENNHEIVGIAYKDNLAVGYCTGLVIQSMCYGTRRLDIEALYVKERHRRQGIGKALLAFVEQRGTARGICHVHMNVHSDNEIALDAYSKQGYTPSREVLLEKDVQCRCSPQ